jgi:hypothetical protein
MRCNQTYLDGKKPGRQFVTLDQAQNHGGLKRKCVHIKPLDNLINELQQKHVIIKIKVRKNRLFKILY